MNNSSNSAHNGTIAGANGDAGFRLPPISFLSGGHGHQQLVSAATPAERDQMDVKRSENGGIFAKNRGASFSADSRLSLPEPQALNMYPRRISATGALAGELTVQNDGHGLKLGNKIGDSGNTDGNSQLAKHHHHHYSAHSHHHHHHHHHPNSKHHHHAKGQNMPMQEIPKNVDQTRLSYPNIHSEGRVLGVHRDSHDPSAQAKRQRRAVREKVYSQLEKEFPKRRHLGTIVYNPTTTWETLQIDRLYGLPEHDKMMLTSALKEYTERRKECKNAGLHTYIPMIPPLSGACINNYLEVKVSYRYIKEFVNSLSLGHIERKRALWGGSAAIYTDDSDLLYVLCHLGLFNESLDLTECNPAWQARDVTRPNSVRTDEDGTSLLGLSVTLLLLPSLSKYQGFTRNGLNSRNWAGDSEHCGLSYGVYDVKWESFQGSGSDRSVHKQAAKELQEERSASKSCMSQKNGWVFDRKVLEKAGKSEDVENPENAEKVRKSGDVEVEKSGDAENGESRD